MSPRSRISLIDSFNFAFQGVIHSVRTQRNMRIHLFIAVAVMIAAVAIGVTRMELIALILVIAFVLITEMINSALESATWRPRASTRWPSWPRTRPPAPF
jgi:diacylglycerol kinase (ATP)